MHLSNEELSKKWQWEKMGFFLPQYDRKAMIEKTKKNPHWLHLGAGNIFRAFQANLQQELLNRGEADTGIIVAEGFDYEIIDKMYTPNDDLSILVTLKADGNVDKTVIGSIAESVAMNADDATAWERMKEIFASESLQMVSLTITEKGYNLNQADGDFFPAVKNDLSKGPEKPESYIGKLTALLYYRYRNGKTPIAMVSMDNCSHNGTLLENAVMTYAKAWQEAGLAEPGFVGYLSDPEKVSFTWSMIDKITPRPDDDICRLLEECGVENAGGVMTNMHSFTAPFVNAEEAQYLVIEDRFPNGRPPLEKAGVIFTNRETVDKVEKMKVCTCLNPLHTALAVFGCVLGYRKICDEMKDPELLSLVKGIGYKEGLPVVVDPGIIRPVDFLDEVVEKRIPNPFMPDTPQRIATDTSQKLSVRFGETIKAYRKSDKFSTEQLELIPLVLAGWCRYMMGIDDDGNTFEISSDPREKDIREQLSPISLGWDGDVHSILEPILSDESIFGVNLYEDGLGKKTENYFTQLIRGTGAVRETLKANVPQFQA